MIGGTTPCFAMLAATSGGGVASIARLVIVLDDEEQRECADVPIERNGLLYSTAHAISVAYDVSEEL